MKARLLRTLLVSVASGLFLFGCLGQGGSGVPGSPGISPSSTGVANVGDGSGLNPGSTASAASGPDSSTANYAAPQMPDVPVAPNVDVQDPVVKPREVEYRVEGRITAACRDPQDQRIRKSIEGQLFCRWKDDPGGEFTICGRGRSLYIHDPKTHNFLNTKADAVDAHFGFDFRFNEAPQKVTLDGGGEPSRLLLASNIDANASARQAIDAGQFLYTSPLEAAQPATQKPPDFFGAPNDDADKTNPSDESDLIVYAWAADGYQPTELGVQSYCSHPDVCEPGGTYTLTSFIGLGPIQFTDDAFTGSNLPDPLPACDAEK